MGPSAFTGPASGVWPVMSMSWGLGELEGVEGVVELYVGLWKLLLLSLLQTLDNIVVRENGFELNSDSLLSWS